MNEKIHISLHNAEQAEALMREFPREISRFYLPVSMTRRSLHNVDHERCYLSSPYVFREKDIPVLQKALEAFPWKGILVRNQDVLGFLNEEKETFRDLDVVFDAGMYVFNSEAYLFLKEATRFPLKEFYLPHELTGKEAEKLVRKIGDENVLCSKVVYGKVPAMISANCVRKTLGKCSGKSGFTVIEDRMNKRLPVYCDCDFCYNVIHNAVPLSLHKNAEKYGGYGNLRIDFTDETPEEAVRIAGYFLRGAFRKDDPPCREYTTGHEKKGVL